MTVRFSLFLRRGPKLVDQLPNALVAIKILRCQEREIWLQHSCILNKYKRGKFLVGKRQVEINPRLNDSLTRLISVFKHS